LSLEQLVVDPRFATNSDRVTHRDELEALLNAAFSSRDVETWLDVLRRADVPCARVQTVDQALADPQVLARGMKSELDIDGDRFFYAGNPIKTNLHSSADGLPPPRLGQHTESLLSELIGLSQDQVKHLIDVGAVGGEVAGQPRWRA
jgi:CoA:oxalate CoA-transferase